MTQKQIRKTQNSTPFYYGGIASAMAAACTHPLDLLKVRLQTSTTKGKESLLRNISMIIKKESIFALFNGLSASLLRQLTYSTVRFGGYEELKRRITKNGETEFTVGKAVLCGVGAGAVGGVAGNPADIVNVRMQNDGKLAAVDRRNYKHALDGLWRVAREEGIATLFRGVSANIGRAMIMTSTQLGSYDSFKHLLLAQPFFKDDIRTHFIASLLAGLVATTFSSPIDVVKTRIMSSSSNGGVAGSSGGSGGLLSNFVQIVRVEGPGALFKGWVPSFTRLGPQTILTFLFLEQMKAQYRKHYYHQ